MARGAEGAREALRAAGRFLSTPAGALLLLLLTFLTTTESGHWIAARRHGVPSTPPLFIPFFMPGTFSPGTFGAVIRMGGRVPDRNALVDIGAAGPLAGAAAAVPVILLGLSLSTVVPVQGGDTIRLGEPLLFRLLSLLVIGPVPEGHDVLLHPVALAGWIGLLVTMLNLLPAGQLDGGHVAYALFGPGWGKAASAVPFLLVPLGLLWPGWFVWGTLLLLMGTAHPPTEEDGVPLTRGRRLVGYGAAALLVLCFTPAPVTL
jgi:membrane-associated protease RseP (regulator of RpoE activity)